MKKIENGITYLVTEYKDILEFINKTYEIELYKKEDFEHLSERELNKLKNRVSRDFETTFHRWEEIEFGGWDTLLKTQSTKKSVLKFYYVAKQRKKCKVREFLKNCNDVEALRHWLPSIGLKLNQSKTEVKQAYVHYTITDLD